MSRSNTATSLKNEGKISLLGGKQEFIALGVMDDIDMMIMQHTMATEGEETYSPIKARSGGVGNGMVGKLIQYKGKEAHCRRRAPYGHKRPERCRNRPYGPCMPRGRPSRMRTYKGPSHHDQGRRPCKTSSLADVRLETYVRGASAQAILDASAKVTKGL